MKSRWIGSIIALMLLSVCQGWAQQNKNIEDYGSEKNGFRILENGNVMVEGEIYKTIDDWHRSIKFLQEGRRCKTLTGTSTQSLIPGDCTNNETVIRPEYWPNQLYTIPVVFHIITDTDGTGDISDALIQSQVDILNEDFRAIPGTNGSAGFDTSIQFELVGITRTANRQWFNDRRESQYKAALGWDQNHYLNIYTNTASGYLGYAYLPDGSAGSVYDGVVLSYAYVGREPPNAGIYNLGRTGTHEVGHYLGLQHTFEGGCGSTSAPYTSGDLIADTNPESSAHYDCVQTSTCGSLDPIENYMDYTDDACMTEFTAEQGNRIVCSLLNYRAALAGGTTPPPGDITMSATGYKLRGYQTVDLSWTGATGISVDILRDGSIIATVANNGAYTDNLGVKGTGSYTYQVCEAGSSACSNSVGVTF